MINLLLTPYSLGLLFLGVVVLYFFPSGGVFAAYNGGLLVLLLADFALLPSGRDISVKRGMEEIISLGDEERITVTARLTKTGNRRFRIWGRDEIPPRVKGQPREIELHYRGGGRFEGEYGIYPLCRGDHYFGKINLRCRGPLGMLKRQYSFSPENSLVKVYPLPGFRGKGGMFVPPSLMKQAGLRTSRMVSLGTEFESLREYVPDDDYRQINWKASARCNHLVSNQYQVEKSQNLVLVFDAGRIMMTETGSWNKLDYALNSGLLMGYHALVHGDRLGAMAYADKVEAYLPPDARRSQIRRIAHSLYRLQPRRIEPDYSSAFVYLSRRQNKRSLVCVFTDLVDSKASTELIENVQFLSRKHLVLFVVMGDRYLVETAGGDIKKTSDVYRKAVAEEYLLEREQGMAYLRNRGVEVVEMLPGDDPMKLVGRYLEIKSRFRL